MKTRRSRQKKSAGPNRQGDKSHGWRLNHPGAPGGEKNDKKKKSCRRKPEKQTAAQKRQRIETNKKKLLQSAPNMGHSKKNWRKNLEPLVPRNVRREKTPAKFPNETRYLSTHGLVLIAEKGISGKGWTAPGRFVPMLSGRKQNSNRRAMSEQDW